MEYKNVCVLIFEQQILHQAEDGKEEIEECEVNVCATPDHSTNACHVHIIQGGRQKIARAVENAVYGNNCRVKYAQNYPHIGLPK